MMKRGHSRNGHPAARFFAGIQAPGARFTRTTAWGATSGGKQARKTSVLRLDDRKMLDASLPTLPPTIGEGSERQGRVQPWIEMKKKRGQGLSPAKHVGVCTRGKVYHLPIKTSSHPYSVRVSV